MNSLRRSVQALSLACLGACANTSISVDAAIECASCDSWNQPQQAFRIYGNTYFVGVAGLSSILIDSADGLILLDGGLPQSVPFITENIESLGFSISDVEIIALSHAHFDHVGGIAALQRASGARVIARAPAAKGLRKGGLLADDPQYGSHQSRFPAVEFVETISDNYVLKMGGLEMQLVATPGHSPGGSSWTWESCEDDDCRTVVYADSLNAVSAGAFRFNSGPKSAGVSLRKSIQIVANLDCDIFLSPHPFNFHLQEKLQDESKSNPFIDNGCNAYAMKALEGFDQRRQQEMLR